MNKTLKDADQVRTEGVVVFPARSVDARRRSINNIVEDTSRVDPQSRVHHSISSFLRAGSIKRTLDDGMIAGFEYEEYLVP